MQIADCGAEFIYAKSATTIRIFGVGIVPSAFRIPRSAFRTHNFLASQPLAVIIPATTQLRLNSIEFERGLWRLFCLGTHASCVQLSQA